MTAQPNSHPGGQRTAEGASNPDWHPWAPDATAITTYLDAKQVLTSSKFASVARAGSEPVWGGNLTTSNGSSHLKRRRWLAPLVSRRSVAKFDADVLDLAMNEYLGRRLYAQAEYGNVDLIPLLRLMLVPIMAGFVGIDGDFEAIENSARLRGYIGDFNAGSSLLQYAKSDDHDELVAQALASIEAFADEFYRPSRARREQLVERFRAGEIDEDDLPRDVLTRQLLDEQGLWDERTAVRDAITLLTGGLHTTAVGTAQILDTYYNWAGRSDADHEDEELLRAIVNEVLRVYPVVEFLPRTCVEDTTLKSGREITAGTEIVVNLYLANHDPAVFGADADAFRPERYKELAPDVQHYGLAFGAGPHLCIGRPLVVLARSDSFETSIPRTLPKILKRLLAAGIRPASDEDPTLEDTFRRMLRTYPVDVPAGGCPFGGTDAAS